MRNAFPKSTLLTFDRNDIFFLLRMTRRHGRIASTHGGKPSQLEVHSAKKLYHHFLLVEQLNAHVALLQRNLTVPLDGIGPMNARVQPGAAIFSALQ
jgi:hypothetical protein